MSKIYAVHFLTRDMQPHIGKKGAPWKVGETRSVTGTLKLCENGLHYCPTWKAAIEGGYLYGPMACVVEVDDDGPKDATKGCSRTRTLIEVFDVESAMRLFAADEAARALKACEKRTGTKADPRSWAAVKAARAHADGRITDAELAAARAAAWAAARAAAWDAARDAAWAAARAAAWAAARAAAWDAAGSRFAVAMHKATGWADA